MLIEAASGGGAPAFAGATAPAAIASAAPTDTTRAFVFTRALFPGEPPGGERSDDSRAAFTATYPA